MCTYFAACRTPFRLSQEQARDEGKIVSDQIAAKREQDLSKQDATDSSSTARSTHPDDRPRSHTGLQNGEALGTADSSSVFDGGRLAATVTLDISMVQPAARTSKCVFACRVHSMIQAVASHSRSLVAIAGTLTGMVLHVMTPPSSLQRL
jgi:hypothetical protein